MLFQQYKRANLSYIMVEITDFDIDMFNFRKVPKIIFYKSENKEDFIEYNGIMRLRELKQFVTSKIEKKTDL